MNIKKRFDKAKRIGLFDSGLGGLSVLKQLLSLPQISLIENPGSKQLESKEYVYFADTARCPYGGRSQEEIQQFVKQIVNWLATNNVDLVIMACNTSAALVDASMRDEQSEFALPMIDLLHSTANSVKKNNLKRIGVMSTKATASTLAFTKSIQLCQPDAEIFELACPDLVPLVESNQAKSREAVAALDPYATQLIAHNVDAIIYGCTHFPFLQESMRRCLAEKNALQIQMIDPAVCLRAELLDDSKELLRLDMSETSMQTPEFDFADLNARCRFITTGNVETFSTGIGANLGLPLNQIEHVEVGILTGEKKTPTNNTTSDNASSSLK